jgi:hypothetical protein
MNLMILKRFKNELIISVATIFMIYSIFYKISSDNFVKEKKADIELSINEISRIVGLKDIWKSKKISKNIKHLNSIVSKSKIESYKKRGQKVIVKYKGLNTKELNSVTKYIMNNSFQIVRWKIDRVAKDNYRVELICKW